MIRKNRADALRHASPELLELMQDQESIGYIQCSLGGLLCTYKNNNYKRLEGCMRDAVPLLNRKKFIRLSEGCVASNDYVWWYCNLCNGQIAIMCNREELRVAEGKRTRAFLRRMKNIMSIANHRPEEDEYQNYGFMKWPLQ